MTDLDPTVPQALGRLRVALDGAYQRVSRRFGLSPQQAELLCAAMRPGPVGDMARELRCDRSNVTRLADRAADRGLLIRRVGDEDGRVKVIELSPAGMDVAQRFIAALEDELANVLDTWSDRRQRQAVRLLTALAAALEERGHDAEWGRSLRERGPERTSGHGEAAAR